MGVHGCAPFIAHKLNELSTLKPFKPLAAMTTQASVRNENHQNNNQDTFKQKCLPPFKIFHHLHQSNSEILKNKKKGQKPHIANFTPAGPGRPTPLPTTSIRLVGLPRRHSLQLP